MTECLFKREDLMGEGGSMLTLGLFLEFKHQTPSNKAVYTLREVDWKGYLSMYKIYMECESEYEASQKLLGSWIHWKKLCECNWFKPYLEAWREEVLIREAAIGKKTLIEAALEGSVSAAKELNNQVKDRDGKKGRPSKEEKEKIKNRVNQVDQKVISLLERING